MEFQELIEFTRCRIYCFLSWNAYKYSGIFSMDQIEISTAKLCWQIQIEEWKMFHVYLKCFLFFVYFSVLLFMANFTQLLNLRCFRRKDFHNINLYTYFYSFPFRILLKMAADIATLFCDSYGTHYSYEMDIADSTNNLVTHCICNAEMFG